MVVKKCSQCHASGGRSQDYMESEAPQHPLQNNWKAGPKGAYEVKRVNNGLYVRVDMPGVPSLDDVKVNKKSGKCSITFYGRAPKREGWPLGDSHRVYAGSIDLDCDPEAIPLENTFKNGCLRLFLPGADGNIIFLTNQAKLSAESQLQLTCADVQVHQPDVTIVGLVNVKLHEPECRCCKGEHADIQERTCTQETSCINPSILQGVRSVFETKFVQEKDGNGWEMYFRLDMPGFGAETMCEVKVEKKCCIIFGPMGSKEYPLDEGGRSYFCKLTLGCGCCCILSDSAVYELKDGVMRMWFKISSTHKKNNSSAKFSTSSLRSNRRKSRRT